MRGVDFPLLLTVAFFASGCEQDRSGLTEPTDAQFAKSSKLKVDQSNTVTDHLGLDGFVGQTFVPKENNVAQVDVLLITNQIPAAGVMTTVGIYRDITQAPIATTVSLIGPAVPGEVERVVSYSFDPPVPLDKGAEYTLGFDSPRGEDGLYDVSWEFSYGDTYRQGQAILSDGLPLNPTGDFFFITYALK